MSYTVIFTDTARQDLRDIALWIADQSKDLETARHFVNELRENCKRLNKFPSTGVLPRDHILKSLGYRFIPYKDYLIFYLTDDENKSVTVMAIFNARQDYMRIMKRFI